MNKLPFCLIRFGKYDEYLFRGKWVKAHRIDLDTEEIEIEGYFDNQVFWIRWDVIEAYRSINPIQNQSTEP